MGAQVFMVFAEGETADKAFNAAVNQAQWDHGSTGYTGTIAEKLVFEMVDPPENVASMNHLEVETWIESQIQKPLDIEFGKERPFWYDKWGPAAGIKVGEQDYYFFGWAST